MNTIQQQRLDLAALLAAERDYALRHGPKASYPLDGEQVPYAGWVTVMTDRYNQLVLACQLEGHDVELQVPEPLPRAVMQGSDG